MNCFNIGVLGSVDSGKSTLIGVLKTNQLDDGRGLVRKFVMKHNHELTSGRTSCISYNNIEIKDKLYNFVDLAGHESYLKTTIYGLNALHLNYVIIIIGANMGVNNMTREHFNLARILQLPIIFVINKIDLAPENIINNTLKDLKKLVNIKNAETNKINIILDDNIESHKLLFYNRDTNSIILNDSNIDKIVNYDKMTNDYNNNAYPVFFTSNKIGYGISVLRDYLYNLHVKHNFNINTTNNTNDNTTNNIYIIQESYNIKGIGMVFYGYVKSGVIKKNDILNIGPFGGKFYKISIRNVRDVLENDVDTLYENQLGCIAIKQLNKDVVLKRDNIKKGIYITSDPYCCNEFIARIYILHHPTTIRENYQSTIHCGSVIQAAKIIEILNIKKNVESDNKLLRTGDYAKVKFKFMFKPEFVENDSLFIFRENNAKGVGKILSTVDL